MLLWMLLSLLRRRRRMRLWRHGTARHCRSGEREGHGGRVGWRVRVEGRVRVGVRVRVWRRVRVWGRVWVRVWRRVRVWVGMRVRVRAWGRRRRELDVHARQHCGRHLQQCSRLQSRQEVLHLLRRHRCVQRRGLLWRGHELLWRWLQGWLRLHRHSLHWLRLRGRLRRRQCALLGSRRCRLRMRLKASGRWRLCRRRLRHDAQWHRCHRKVHLALAHRVHVVRPRARGGRVPKCVTAGQHQCAVALIRGQQACWEVQVGQQTVLAVALVHAPRADARRPRHPSPRRLAKRRVQDAGAGGVARGSSDVVQHELCRPLPHARERQLEHGHAHALRSRQEHGHAAKAGAQHGRPDILCLLRRRQRHIHRDRSGVLVRLLVRIRHGSAARSQLHPHAARCRLKMMPHALCQHVKRTVHWRHQWARQLKREGESGGPRARRQQLGPLRVGELEPLRPWLHAPLLLLRLLLWPLLRLLVRLLLLVLLYGSRNFLRSRPLRPGPRGRSVRDSSMERAVIIGRHCAAVRSNQGCVGALAKLRATHH
jgi:hypothetical protein